MPISGPGAENDRALDEILNEVKELRSELPTTAFADTVTHELQKIRATLEQCASILEACQESLAILERDADSYTIS